MDTNVNVEAAKNHYVHLLKKSMTPIMLETFVKMYKEAITRGKGNRIATMNNFMVLLDEVTNWNNSIISTHAKEYENSCQYFSDLLAAVFVCYVKILSTVRLTKDSKKIQVKLPTNDNFVHACLNNAAKEFKKHSHVFREPIEDIRNQKIKMICGESIQHTLDELVPIQTILRTFMVADPSQFEFGNSEAEPEPEPEPEPEFEPEEGEEEPEENEEHKKEQEFLSSQQQQQQPLPPPPPSVPDPTMKHIPIKHEFNRPPLFPDAPDSREKLTR